MSIPFRWRHRFPDGISTTVAKLKGIVEADETFFLDNRKGDRVWTCAREGKPSADMPDKRARKHGGEAIKWGLSDEQVLVLIAADCSGTTVSAVLPAVNADALRKAFAPVMDKDALLVTDGNTSYPPCAVALGLSHEAFNQSSGKRASWRTPYPERQQPSLPPRGFHWRSSGDRHKVFTRYLHRFRLIVLQRNPTSRLRLASAMGTMCVDEIRD